MTITNDITKTLHYEFYTDGAASNNGYENCKAGWGLMVVLNGVAKEGQYGKVERHGEYMPTNNRGELLAIIKAYEFFTAVYDTHKDTHTFPNATIYSDSAYCVNGLNDWMHKWQVAGWTKKGGIKNLDLWKILYDYYMRYKDIIAIKKVKGHSDNEYNNMADKLAVRGAKGVVINGVAER